MDANQSFITYLGLMDKVFGTGLKIITCFQEVSQD